MLGGIKQHSLMIIISPDSEGDWAQLGGCHPGSLGVVARWWSGVIGRLPHTRIWWVLLVSSAELVIGWDIQTWPPRVPWAPSQHSGWVPRMSVLPVRRKLLCHL